MAGVPADASAVYANITVLNQTANGYLRTYAADQPAPSTGALDFDDSATAQSVAIPLSADGQFKVLVGAGGPVDLVIDIQGYFTAAADQATFTPAAVHLLDTRVAPVRTLAGNSVTKLSVAGVAGIPAVADGLGAVALNLRTVQPATGAAGGYLRLWPSDQPEPATSNVNYTTAEHLPHRPGDRRPGRRRQHQHPQRRLRPGRPGDRRRGLVRRSRAGLPIVVSSAYPAHSWTPAGGPPATFTITDNAAASPATRFSYRLDDATPTTVTGPVHHRASAADRAGPAHPLGRGDRPARGRLAGQRVHLQHRRATVAAHRPSGHRRRQFGGPDLDRRRRQRRAHPRLHLRDPRPDHRRRSRCSWAAAPPAPTSCSPAWTRPTATPPRSPPSARPVTAPPATSTDFTATGDPISCPGG